MMTIDTKHGRELLAECARLPWKIEHDWTLELQDADGNLLGKFMAGAAPGKPVVPLLLFTVNNAEALLDAEERVEAFEAQALKWATEAEERITAARDEAVRRAEAAEGAIRAYLSAHEGPFPSAEVKARQGMRDVLATLDPKEVK